MFRRRRTPHTAVEGDVPIPHTQRFYNRADQPAYESYGCAHGRGIQLHRPGRRRADRHLYGSGRIWRMGSSMANDCHGGMQSHSAMDIDPMAADGCYIVDFLERLFRHRVKNDVNFIPEHPFPIHLLFLYWQPCGTRIAWILHSGRQMEQDGHIIAISGTYIDFHPHSVGRTGSA